MARHGMAWHGTAWHGMERHGTAWHGMARHGMAWHGMAWHGTARHGMARHGTAWHGMARHGTAWHGMARHGTAWHGMARHGTAWHGMARAWHGTAWHVRHGTNMARPLATRVRWTTILTNALVRWGMGRHGRGRWSGVESVEGQAGGRVGSGGSRQELWAKVAWHGARVAWRGAQPLVHAVGASVCVDHRRPAGRCVQACVRACKSRCVRSVGWGMAG
jgi:hypothetical protein